MEDDIEEVIDDVDVTPSPPAAVVVNPNIPPETDLNLYYRIGIDVGTSNFAYVISAIPDEEDLTVLKATVGPDSDLFLPIGQIAVWKVIALEGIDTKTWCLSMCKKLSEEPIIANDRIAEVYIEQQLPLENPVCNAISSGIVSFFGGRAAIFKSGLPRLVDTPNPQLKFGFFGIRCPSGSKNYNARKAISAIIVRALMNRWVQNGLMHPYWRVHFEKNFGLKPDDASDALLLKYTAAMERLRLEPSVPARRRMIDWIKTQTNLEYGSGVLELTVSADKKFARYDRKLVKDQQKKLLKGKKPAAKNKRILKEEENPLIAVVSNSKKRKQSTLI